MQSLDANDDEDLKMVKKSIAREGIVINNLDNVDLTMMKRSTAMKDTVIGRS